MNLIDPIDRIDLIDLLRTFTIRTKNTLIGVNLRYHISIRKICESDDGFNVSGQARVVYSLLPQIFNSQSTH